MKIVAGANARGSRWGWGGLPALGQAPGLEVRPEQRHAPPALPRPLPPGRVCEPTGSELEAPGQLLPEAPSMHAGLRDVASLTLVPLRRLPGWTVAVTPPAPNPVPRPESLSKR